MGLIEIESTNAKFISDLIDWLNKYPDGNGVTIRIPDRRRITELERLLTQAENEARAVAESTGCMIVCREGGGPENIWGTLALSVSRLKDQRDTVKGDLGEYQKMLAESHAREGRLRELLRRAYTEWGLVNEDGDPLTKEQACYCTDSGAGAFVDGKMVGDLLECLVCEIDAALKQEK